MLNNLKFIPKRTPSVLIIYTGGTIGMIKNPDTEALEAFNFDHLLKHVPEVKEFHYRIASYQFVPPIDSSNISPEHWERIAKIIEYNYDNYDGFVILHGTDTMAYTASALSFMLENLSKPVILTGSQLPIGVMRTDGKENLLTAIEIAAMKDEDDNAIVPEVCIYFQSKLLRGNRTTKFSAEHFNAFRSNNYPALADAGVHITFEQQFIRHVKHNGKPLKLHTHFNTNVIVLTLFPGIQENIVRSILNTPGLKAAVIRTFGSGNALQQDWFLNVLSETCAKGVVIVNISQCAVGHVAMHLYETGRQLLDTGIISGFDSTVEAAVTKLMLLLGEETSTETIKHKMCNSLAGEITV